MGNFTVKPENLRASAKDLSDTVAPAYADSSTNIKSGAQVDAPGFGVLLSWLQAVYDQDIDYVTKDLQGAHDVVNEVANRLIQTAGEYEKGEDLNIKGFDGKPQHEQDFMSSWGQVLGADASSYGSAALPVAVSLDAIYAALVAMGACSALCPAFIPATVAAALMVANLPSIWDAHSMLTSEGNRVKTEINVAFAGACGNAASGWEGEGQLNFQNLTTKVKSHLDQVGDFLGKLGAALTSLLIALGTFWLAIIALVGPFLVWLIAMTVSEVLPWDIPVVEAVKEAAGAAASGGVLTTIAGVVAVAGVVVTLFNTLLQKALDLNLPDSGKSGVPDMTEFHVGDNYQVAL